MRPIPFSPIYPAVLYEEKEKRAWQKKEPSSWRSSRISA